MERVGTVAVSAAHAPYSRGTARRVEYCAVIGRRAYRYLVYVAI